MSLVGDVEQLAQLDDLEDAPHLVACRDDDELRPGPLRLAVQRDHRAGTRRVAEREAGEVDDNAFRPACDDRPHRALELVGGRDVELAHDLDPHLVGAAVAGFTDVVRAYTERDRQGAHCDDPACSRRLRRTAQPVERLADRSTAKSTRARRVVTMCTLSITPYCATGRA